MTRALRGWGFPLVLCNNGILTPRGAMAPDGDQRTGGGLSPSIDPLADGGGKYSLRDQCTRPARATPCGVAAPTRPTCSSSVPCMLLTAWRSSAAVTLHRGPGAKRLRDVQLAISAASCTSTIEKQHGFVPGSRRVRCGPPMRASPHPPDRGASRKVKLFEPILATWVMAS